MAHIKDILNTMDYGPAPEGNDHVARLAGNATRPASAISSTASSRTPARRRASTSAIRPTASCSRESRDGSAADVDARGRGRDAAPSRLVEAVRPRARPLSLRASPGIIQKRERFLAVLETMDNGKPIRETRDIDIPLVARHFYHHAGWAELLESEFPGYRPVGVCGQIIPWNFPLLMLAWKIAPALAAGNTVVLKPAEYTPLTALAFAEICREVGPAGRRRQHRHRRRARPARRSSRMPASTRSPSPARPRSAASSARRPPAPARSCRWSSAASRPSSSSTTPISTARSKGVVDAIWFNQGQVCCAGSRLLVQEGVAETLLRQAARPHGDAARRRSRSTSRSTSAPSSSTVQLERIRALVEKGRAEGADAVPAVDRHARRPAASIRRRCSPTSSPPRPSPESRSSGRCWSP